MGNKEGGWVVGWYSLRLNVKDQKNNKIIKMNKDYCLFS